MPPARQQPVEPVFTPVNENVPGLGHSPRGADGAGAAPKTIGMGMGAPGPMNHGAKGHGRGGH